LRLKEFAYKRACEQKNLRAKEPVYKRACEQKSLGYFAKFANEIRKKAKKNERLVF
jgi:hypothetical protein